MAKLKVVAITWRRITWTSITPEISGTIRKFPQVFFNIAKSTAIVFWRLSRLDLLPVSVAISCKGNRNVGVMLQPAVAGPDGLWAQKENNCQVWRLGLCIAAESALCVFPMK